jgi:hypothetical protein
MNATEDQCFSILDFSERHQELLLTLEEVSKQGILFAQLLLERLSLI